MSTTTNLGCVYCGETLTLNSPDYIHIVPLRSWTFGYNWFDYIPMDAKCTRCEKSNWIYWLRPVNYNWYRTT